MSAVPAISSLPGDSPAASDKSDPERHVTMSETELDGFDEDLSIDSPFYQPGQYGMESFAGTQKSLTYTRPQGAYDLSTAQKLLLKSSVQVRTNQSMEASDSPQKEAKKGADPNSEDLANMEVENETVKIAAQMVRTKLYDSSARVMKPSQTQHKYEIPTVYQSVDKNSYCAPCDRIGRMYNPSSAGLTMQKAAKVAQNRQNFVKNTTKDVTVNLSATAPAAFEATMKIRDIATNGGKKSMEKKNNEKDWSNHLPSNTSAWAMREQHRMIRSGTTNRVLKPFDSSLLQASATRNFNDWNPVSVDAGKTGKVVTDEMIYGSMPEAQKLKLRENTLQALEQAVKAVMTGGSTTASGSGHRRPVVRISEDAIASIIARVPTLYGFLEDPYIERLLKEELNRVGTEYITAAARSALEYELMDKEEASHYGINTVHLNDHDLNTMWTNMEYMLPEWKVLRLTGVNSLTVLRKFQAMNRQLCVPLSVMLQLQYLWIDDTLPESWWVDATFQTRAPYAELMFTNVNSLGFRSTLPMALDSFVAHTESQSKEMRQALTDNWLISAGHKLSSFVHNIDISDQPVGEESTASADHEQGEDEPQDAEKKGPSAMLARLKAEGLEPTHAFGKKTVGDAVATRSSKNKAELVVDSAVVLMSRQLRGMCEMSLFAMIDLFENLRLAESAKYAIFVVELRLQHAITQDLTNDLNSGPVEVCMHPNLADLMEGTSTCVHAIVHNARGFPRPEHPLHETFGGRNAHLMANSINGGRHRKMNECSVTMTDEVVLSVVKRIHGVLEEFYDEPNKLLERFMKLEALLSGEEAAAVAEAIDAVNSSETVTADGLEQLTQISLHLEQLIEDIKTIVDDVVYYPLLEVRCEALKEALINQVRHLLNLIMQAVVRANQQTMASICETYSDIARTLKSEIGNCQDLRALQDFTNKAAFMIIELNDKYNADCFERVKFLMARKHKIEVDDIKKLQITFNWPHDIQAFLKHSFDTQAHNKQKLEELLQFDQTNLDAEITDLAKQIHEKFEESNRGNYRKVVERLTDIRQQLEEKMGKAEDIVSREALLEVPHSDIISRIEELQTTMVPLENLWTAVKKFRDEKSLWFDQSALTAVDPEEAQKTVDELRRTFAKLSKEFDKQDKKEAKSIADEYTLLTREFEEQMVPLMLLVCNPGMQDRHWGEIEQVTGVSIPRGEILNLKMLTDSNIGLQFKVKDIEDICIAASKEYGLKINMDKMESEWEKMEFLTVEHKSGARKLAGIDEIQQLLDDHIVKTQAMKGSRYIKPLLTQITNWEDTLIRLQDILDNWLKVQSAWLYLEPIFSSEDIMRQMPTEGKMFRTVDNTWRHSMAQTYAEPGCVKVANRPGFLASLIEANQKLETIQKGLNDYLETKRLAFPRFFFLSNDELLEILAETKDPLRVQPYLKKCFDGIDKLQFSTNLDITACFDPSNERLDFPYDKVNHKKINPQDSGGNVEQWLIEVEVMMKKSLAYATDVSMRDHLESDRVEWLQRWQGQVVICINQTLWCTEVEKVLSEGVAGIGLEGYYKFLCEELLRTVELVRGKIPKALRTAIGALVVMDVHNRDTINEMAELNVQAKTDFDWLAQLRYYWDDKGESAQSGKPGTTTCRMINAMALYAYEYIGNQGRLVITPLTDRCYRTLMGAIHLNLGGAPEGPAGTGKTETTKDLAKAIAIQCVVTNCSDGLDYLAMAKFFKGLASSGAWACFDEFNRIQLEVLSVIAQQILQIQLAKMRKLEKFNFEGTELELKPTCCPFITMNPGYAGRAELPDNLKVLFRTVAMMVPDYAMISEIILYSFGYNEARALAVKIVTTYKLCSEQLSSQSHYDYGMRAVIAVLRAAGNLKRSDGHLREDILVLRSIIDVNLPKFLSPDVPLFNGIVSDLFPGVVIEPPDRSNMRKAFEDVCELKQLIPEEYFWDKMVQIYDMMVVRHGFMIVGMPFSGKSSGWKVLADVLGLLAQRFPDDKRWSKVLPIVQNPKSIAMGQLYGQFDPVSHEWTDGVLAINYRNAATNKVGNAEDRKWIMFDGPVDAIWIENMNTVLDDNKKLCLMSGDIIAMTEVMSMIFEPMDLLVASPATVSRCGMIYMEPERLGWMPLLKSWIEYNQQGGLFFKQRDPETVKFSLLPGDVRHLNDLFNWIVEPSLCYLRKECIEMSPTVDSNLVMSLLNLFEAMIPKCLVNYEEALKEGNGDITDARILKARYQDIECCFFYALIWSVGKSGVAASQGKFSAFLENFLGNVNCVESDYPSVWNLLMMHQWKKPDFASQSFKGTFTLPMPMRQNYYECAYIPGEKGGVGKWKYWSDMLPAYQITPGTSYSSIVVPNSYTAQFSHVIDLLVPNKVNVLMCGPTGTGKSTYVFNTITTVLPQNIFQPLCLGFSAKTSANMTQDIIDGKLSKRRKGVYGPPQTGQQTVIFIDDLNMPEVETYGAQPPIELVRQLIDNGGWYDLKEKDKAWRQIVDCSVIGAMGPPGGGRNHITPRLLRHFNLFCYGEFDDTSLRRIFSSIVQWHFQTQNFSSDARAMSENIVDATLDTYRAAMAVLLPTPQKSHYTFNLRDFSRIIQGVLLCKASPDFGKFELVRLWSHEALRVFGDRLIDDSDRLWFHKHIENMTITRFGVGFGDCFGRLDPEGKKQVGVNEMRRLLFGDYMSNDDPKSYCEVTDAAELQVRMEEYLSEYNAMSKKPMDLVMFSFAIEHVSRVSRILKMPGGNALLVGVGGSGRQSVTRLAAFMAGYDVFQIEISKNYGKNEWREDLKTILRGAGTGNQPMTFLFSDSQIKQESFVEDINNMLNSGEVPNIFPAEDKPAICEAMRGYAKQLYGKRATDMTLPELYALFIQRVKQNLHIVLVFSPIGDAFRDRLRKFPALINCCTIDWFTVWPGDALMAVAQKFLADVAFDTEEMRQAIVSLCQTFHQNVHELSHEFHSTLKRQNYVTPTSYLELILAFKESLAMKRVEVSQAKARYENGLEKLAYAGEQIVQMQKELNDLQPARIKLTAEAESLMKQVEEKMPGVMETRKVVSAEAAVAQAEADKVQGQKNIVEKELEAAIPALEKAIAALDIVNQKDIDDMKKFTKPHERILLICKAVCIMLGFEGKLERDPNNPGKKMRNYWPTALGLLSGSEGITFIQRLKEFDKDNMSEKIVAEMKRDYVYSNPEFTPEKAEFSSSSCKGMCLWVYAMIDYHDISKEVRPKQEALAKAQAELDATMAMLDGKKAALKAVEDELNELQGQLEGAQNKKAELEKQAEICDMKIGRANQLLDGLGGERERWDDSATKLGERYTKLTGDVLISSGVLAYLGVFTATFREKQVASWTAAVKERLIPCSDNPSLNATLGDPVAIRQWNIEGLPTDAFSVDNGIIVFSVRRWPLMIDPQGQANKWIRNKERANNLQVIKLSDTNYLRALENAIPFGIPVLLENVGEELDPSLEPLLQKQLFKQGGVNYIRLGDASVEYAANFRFYITTKLRNPHYLPEVSVKVTLLNFMITPEGLQDQLLGIVVSQERPDLEEQRNKLVIESAENKRMLKEIEDKILEIMNSSSGSILDDENALHVLNNSKVLSTEIMEKQKIAEETEKNINAVRMSYSPVAYSSQILFFCIADLANIEPVYQYSLTWFINLFVQSIINSEKGRDVEKRLENLDNHFTYSLYKNVCRSLLEKDKLLFSFLLTTRIMGGKGEKDENEWFFLLTGGLGMDNIHPNPASNWLTQKAWDAVCRLSDMAKYSSFRDDFETHVDEWKTIYDSTAPQDELFPGIFSSVEGIGRLCALRTIRPDKVVVAIQKFVSSYMGEKFIKPPPFDLQLCYQDSSAIVPLVFILSAGSDPMGAVLKAADQLKTTSEMISLGQGQGPKAVKCIERAKQKGTWVVLQNCHLAPSFMNTLEKICEDLDPEEVHPGFRLWCTTYPSEIFPVAVLQNGVKMTNEPPKGIRANLLGSFNTDPIADDSFYNSCEKGFEFRRLLFGLCFFHALVQERRLYGPLGWNIPYEFNESDLRISVQQLMLFLNENDFVPFKAIMYTAGECNYGGRVTDDKDRRTLMCILKRFYAPEFLDENHKITPSGSYLTPPDGTRQEFIQFIDGMALSAPPEVFGLHDNATLTKDGNDTNNLLNSVLDTESGGGSGGGGGVNKEEAMTSIAADIAAKTPENFDLEFAQLKYPVVWNESMNTVLCQELIRFNNLLSLMRSTLASVGKAIKGLVVMSQELEVLGNSLFVNRIPILWKSRSYPSLKPLSGYIADQQARLHFFGDWLKNKPPPIFWISGFFFTQAFLTGAAQNFARRYTIPIDAIVFDFKMMKLDSYKKGPEDGVYTTGLFLEGARWDKETVELGECFPKVLFSPAPVMHWMPYKKEELPVYSHYKCPLYKTSDRRGVLATTGHSSNFVYNINMPTRLPEDHWVQRGVAMLTQLDD